VWVTAALAVLNKDRQVAVTNELVENKLLANELGDLCKGGANKK
jgi:hypothetical protein